jgi:hypothetical protein
MIFYRLDMPKSHILSPFPNLLHLPLGGCQFENPFSNQGHYSPIFLFRFLNLFS